MGAPTRIQLCGRFVVRLDGERIEDALPGRKGRLLFAYLALHRGRPATRDDLLIAGWGEDAPREAGPALSVTLSKLRSVLGPGRLCGRTEVELVLPADTIIDVESALEGAHRAEGHIARSEWAEAWGPAAIPVHVCERPLMPGYDAAWLEPWRRRLADTRERGLEAFATCALMLGGPAARTAEQSARLLVSIAPFRESGYRLLMECLAASGNVAEALRVYDQLRVRLGDELGIAPGPELQRLHQRLLSAR